MTLLVAPNDRRTHGPHIGSLLLSHKPRFISHYMADELPLLIWRDSYLLNAIEGMSGRENLQAEVELANASGLDVALRNGLGDDQDLQR